MVFGPGSRARGRLAFFDDCHENYTAVSEDYDRTRVPIGIEIILGCLASGGCPLASLRVLDAGCGTGNYAAELRGYVGAIWNKSDGVRPYGFSAW